MDPIVTPDASATPEELNAHIDSELGIKAATKPEPEVEVVPEVIPEAEPEVEVVPETVPSDPDFSIEVEDADGKKHKISTIEDLPEDFNPRNNRQILQIISDLGKLDVQKEKFEADNLTKAEQEQAAETERQTLQSWDNEISELQKEGRLEKPKVTPDSPAFMEDESVKKVDAVFKYMVEVNEVRTKAGNPNLLRSFEDALDKYEAVEGRRATEEASKNGTVTAKAKAAVIGRSGSGTAAEAPTYRSGQYKSIDDIPVTL